MNGRILRPIFGLRVSSTVERLFLLAVVMLLAVFMPHTPDTLSLLVPIGVGIGGMMIDHQARLASAQAFSATAVTQNTYDNAVAGRDPGRGEPLGLMYTVTVAADAANADETYEFQLIQSANADLSSPDILLKTDTAFITRAVLTAGRRVVIPFPPEFTKRYVGGRLVLGGTTPSITVNCDIVPLSAVQTDKAYPDGITISS